MSSLSELARRLKAVERAISRGVSQPQLAYSSIEDGNVQEYDRDGTLVGIIGKQNDGTHIAASVNGPTPPTPAGLTVTGAAGGIVVKWDGTWEGAVVAPMDFLRVDVKASMAAGFDPLDPTTTRVSFISPRGGESFVPGTTGTWYVALVGVTASGKLSVPTLKESAIAIAPSAGSDGLPPTSSPTPDLLGASTFIQARWTAITNADPVTYDVHISTVDNFIPDSTTKVAETTGTIATIKALPGLPPADPEIADPRKLLYGTTYYVKIIARDEDGSAAASAQASTVVQQLTGDDLAVNSVTAEVIAAASISGRELAGEVVLAGDIKTATEGQRVHMGTDVGLKLYAADGSILVDFPTDAQQRPMIDGDLIAQSIRVSGGSSFESQNNEFARDSIVTLAESTTSPLVAPTMIPEWGATTLDTQTPQTGPMGTFAFNANEVRFVRYKNTQWWAYQNRSNGCRVWKFDVNGVFVAIFDQISWQYFGEVDIGAVNYTLLRSTIGWDYHLWHDDVLNPVSLAQPNRTPLLSTDGTNLFLAETPANKIQIRRISAPMTNGTPVAVLSTLNCAADLTVGAEIGTALYGSFDFGSPRYVFASHADPYNFWVCNTDGTHDVNNDFESPSAAKRGTLWNGSWFYTLGSDGVMYWHWGPKWTTESNKWWGSYTYYDDVVAGTGLHETEPGNSQVITMKKRAAARIFLPTFTPGGGDDDPKKIRFYLARQAGEPILTEWHLQTTTTDNSFAIFTPNWTGAAPDVNPFPGATPAKLRTSRLHSDGESMLWFNGVGEGRWLGEDWHTVGDATTGMGTTFASGYSAVGGYPVQFRKDPMGQVELRGLIATASPAASGQTVFTLPVGYRPTGVGAITRPQHSGASGVIPVLVVLSGGAVQWVNKVGTITIVGGQIGCNIVYSTR